MNQFAYDMGKLTKPAQAVVNELLGMHGAGPRARGHRAADAYCPAS